MLKYTKLNSHEDQDLLIKHFKIDVVFVKNQLSMSFITGLKILDVLRDRDWSHNIFEASFSRKFIEEIANELMEVSFEDYGLRNL